MNYSRLSALAGLFAVTATLAMLPWTPGTGAAPGPGVQPASARPFDLRLDGLATGDGHADDGPALEHAFSMAASSGRPLHIPSGIYFSRAAIDWDLANSALKGVTVSGDGPRLSVIRFGPASRGGLSVSCSRGCAAFFGTFRDFGVEGHIDAPILRMGDTDCRDALNEFRLENIAIQNGGDGPESAAVELNGFYNGYLAATLDCGGPKNRCDALRLRSTQFSVFAGSQGNAGTGTRFTGNGHGRCGYSFGNTFEAIDYEVLHVGIVAESPAARSNTWIGGQMAHAAIPFDFTAGQSNRIINMNLGGPINGPVVENGVGLRLEIPGANTTPTPVMPPPGIPLTNSGGQAIAVNILGGRVTKVLAGNSTVCLATGCSVTISPGESITVDYTTKPSWVWRPIAY